MRSRPQFWSDRRGVTAVEYGIMAALIATALVTAVGSFAPALSTVFSNISNMMKTS